MAYDKRHKEFGVKPFKIVNRTSIHHGDGIENNVQVKGVRTIIQLYKNFQADYVYVDRGHGSMQTEELSRYFFQMGVPHKFKAIDFASNYPYEDLFTGETINKRMKVMLVYFLQKRFEFREIRLSSTEESALNMLVEQLNGYYIEKYDNREQPIFASQKGDHIIDGLMLAVFAFLENHTSLFEKNFSIMCGTVRKETTDKSEMESIIEKDKEKPKEAQEIFDPNMYNTPADAIANEITLSPELIQNYGGVDLIGTISKSSNRKKKSRRRDFDVF